MRALVVRTVVAMEVVRVEEGTAANLAVGRAVVKVRVATEVAM